ncbi:hypothetical protein ACT80S_11850 [Ramlibacter sp. MAHUQ-53]|uniref:hypothetical protein n=1 Tax=unclassified Ramlibacter TaxID=2617605 RepID=UPI003629759B
MDKTPPRQPSLALHPSGASPLLVDGKTSGSDAAETPAQWTARSVSLPRFGRAPGHPPFPTSLAPAQDAGDAAPLQARHVAVVREGKASGQFKRGREPEADLDSLPEEATPAPASGVRLTPALGTGFHWPQEGSAWRSMEVIFGERDLEDPGQRAAALGEVLRYACRNLGRRADRLALGVALAGRLQAVGVGPAAQARELREVLEAGRWAGSQDRPVRPGRLRAALGDLVRGMASACTGAGDYERRLATFATGIYQARGGRNAVPMHAYRLVGALRTASEAVAQPAHLRVDLLRGMLAPVVDAASGAPTRLAPETCASIVEGLAGGTAGDLLQSRLMTGALLEDRIPLTPGQLAGCLGALASWGRPASDDQVRDHLADLRHCPRPAAHKGAAALAVARIDPAGRYDLDLTSGGPGNLAMDLARTRQRILDLVRPSTRAEWAQWLEEAAPLPEATSTSTTTTSTPPAASTTTATSSTSSSSIPGHVIPRSPAGPGMDLGEH